MPIKLCYKNEIHKVTKNPQDFTSLLQTLKEIFHNELPEKFNLQYEDSEGDRVVLASNEDYKLALESEVSNSSRTLKVFLVDADEASNASFISKNFLDQLEESSLKAVEKTEEKEVPPAERDVKISKEFVPEPSNKSFIQATIDDPALCQQINKSFNKCYWKKEKGCERRKDKKKTEFSNIPCDCKGEAKMGEKPCRLCYGTGLLKQKEAKKREMTQSMIRETLHRELPIIVQAVKELIQHPEKSVQNVIPKKVEEKKIEEPKVNKPTHHKVECDVCGVCPIVGVRYKCSVIEDFDLCEKCEATIDHPYPLLKIKNDSQHPVKVITILNEDAPQQPQQNHRSQHNHQSNHRWGPRRGCHWGRRYNPEVLQERVQGFLNNLPGLSAEQKTSLGSAASTVLNNISNVFKNATQEHKAQQTQEAQKQEDETPKGLDYDASFVKELNTIPDRIEVKDLVIYKTISIRNDGLNAWPKTCFIETEGEIVGETCKLPTIESGKEFSTVLIIRSPTKAGKFQSKWRFGYVDEKGNKKTFGKNFAVEFEIAGEKDEQNMFSQVEDTNKKQYSAEILKKAEAIVEIFPQVKLEEVCEYIEQDLSKSVEELMQDYIAILE